MNVIFGGTCWLNEQERKTAEKRFADMTMILREAFENGRVGDEGVDRERKPNVDESSSSYDSSTSVDSAPHEDDDDEDTVSDHCDSHLNLASLVRSIAEWHLTPGDVSQDDLRGKKGRQVSKGTRQFEQRYGREAAERLKYAVRCDSEMRWSSKSGNTMDRVAYLMCQKECIDRVRDKFNEGDLEGAKHLWKIHKGLFIKKDKLYGTGGQRTWLLKTPTEIPEEIRNVTKSQVSYPTQSKKAVKCQCGGVVKGDSGIFVCQVCRLHVCSYWQFVDGGYVPENALSYVIKSFRIDPGNGF